MIKVISFCQLSRLSNYCRRNSCSKSNDDEVNESPYELEDGTQSAIDELKKLKTFGTNDDCQCTFVCNQARPIIQVSNGIQRGLRLDMRRNARSKSKGGNPSPCY